MLSKNSNYELISPKHTVEIIGAPPRPVQDPEWDGVKFLKLTDNMLMELNAFWQVCSFELDVYTVF